MGVVIAARAGYDPWGLPGTLQTLAGIKADDSHLALLFKTHPAPAARLEKLSIAMGTSFDSIAGGGRSADRFTRVTQRLHVADAR